jgi:hypothetical protein
VNDCLLKEGRVEGVLIISTLKSIEVGCGGGGRWSPYHKQPRGVEVPVTLE